MATLSQKTDEIAALESLKKDLAKFEMKQAKATKADVKVKIAAKIKGIREQIKAGKTKEKDVSAKQLANSLLRSRKKFLEMSKKDFNGVIRQLSKKPEYSFLKGMSRTEVINDINRKAKPVGWRFKGRNNYKTPTKEQVRKGRANGTVYYENRPNRSDVSQARQLAKGGSTYAEGGEIYEIHSKHKDGSDSFEVDSNLQTWNTHSDAKKQADQLNKDSNSFKYKVVKKGGSTYAEGGEIERGEMVFVTSENDLIAEVIRIEDTNDILVEFIGERPSGGDKRGSYKLSELKYAEYDWDNDKYIKMSKGGSTYAEGGALKPLPNNNKGLPKLPKEVRNRMGYMAKGGSLKGHGLAIGDEIVNVYRDDIYVLNRGVVYMVDLSSGKRTMTKMSKDDAISTFKDGGEVKEDPQVIRYYFEDDGYEYEKGGSTYNDDPNDLYGAFEKGGEVDINDIEIPVHYTMFEEEIYEYGKGGNTEQKYLVKRVFKNGSKSRVVDENLSEKEAQEMVQEDIENNPKGEYYMLVYTKMN